MISKRVVKKLAVSSKLDWYVRVVWFMTTARNNLTSYLVLYCSKDGDRPLLRQAQWDRGLFLLSLYRQSLTTCCDAVCRFFLPVLGAALNKFPHNKQPAALFRSFTGLIPTFAYLEVFFPEHLILVYCSVLFSTFRNSRFCLSTGRLIIHREVSLSFPLAFKANFWDGDLKSYQLCFRPPLSHTSS